LDTEKTETATMAINEVQLVLSENRTSLALMRTGIAALVLPLSILGLLVATSKGYDVLHVLHFLIPLGILILFLVVFGVYLIVRSIIRMRHYDLLIR